MQDYLIIKGQIDPIENENATEAYKANEWLKLDRIVSGTIRMHFSESLYFTVQTCSKTFELWKTLLKTYEKKVASTKIVSDPAPLQLTDERIRFGSGTPQRVQKSKLPNFVSGDNNRG